MKLARVTGTVTATVKDPAFSASTLLICNVENGKGAVLEEAMVAIDACGAGVGDLVLITTGSAARMPAGSSGTPVDATVIAIVDTVTL